MLTKFKLFESRFFEVPGYMTELSLSECDNKLKTLNYFNFSDMPIYRGFGYLESGCYVIDPSVSKRQSANTMNYYTELLNNLDGWKNYPERKLICSTDALGASSELYSKIKDSKYRNMYFRVIPLNKLSKIGICKDIDMWGSLTHVLKMFGVDSEGFMDASFLSDIFFASGVKEDYKDIINNFESGLIEYKKQYKEIGLDDNLMQYFDIDLILNQIKEVGTKRFLEKAFDPNLNSFELYDYVKYSKLSEVWDKEIWLDSKCLIISQEIIDERYS